MWPFKTKKRLLNANLLNAKMNGQQEVIRQLLSLLDDESKFRSLFRTLIDPGNSQSESFPTPNSYVFANYFLVGPESYPATWVFVVTYLPPALHQPEAIPTIFETEFRQALTDMKSFNFFPFSNPRRAITYWLYFISNFSGSTYLAGSQVTDTAYRMLGEFGIRPQSGFPKLQHFATGDVDSIAENGPENETVLTEIAALASTPSCYLAIARGGQFSLVPTVDHGLSFASQGTAQCIGEAENGAAATSCSTIASVRRIPPGHLAQFETLLNSHATNEADLQAFFEEFPAFLLSLDDRYSEIRPHVSLIDTNDNRLIPDFMARIEDSNIWDIIDLKLPHLPITREKTPLTPAAIAARGIGQLLQYRNYFDYSGNRKRFAAQFGAHGYDPALVLVLGRGRTMYEWSTVKARFPAVRVVPYDYLLERAKTCRRLLDNLTSPKQR